MFQALSRLVILGILLATLVAITGCKSSSPPAKSPPGSPPPVGAPRY